MLHTEFLETNQLLELLISESEFGFNKPTLESIKWMGLAMQSLNKLGFGVIYYQAHLYILITRRANSME